MSVHMEAKTRGGRYWGGGAGHVDRHVTPCWGLASPATCLYISKSDPKSPDPSPLADPVAAGGMELHRAEDTFFLPHQAHTKIKLFLKLNVKLSTVYIIISKYTE